MEQPSHEHRLDNKVKRNVLQNKHDCALCNAKCGKDDPVSEPLCIIFGSGRFNCLERHVGGVEETDQVGDEFHASEEGDERQQGGDSCDEEVGLGVAGLLFDFG